MEKTKCMSFLFAYHCTTQVAPADLMFQRKITAYDPNNF